MQFIQEQQRQQTYFATLEKQVGRPNLFGTFNDVLKIK
jgi:hypothetical protein